MENSYDAGLRSPLGDGGNTLQLIYLLFIEIVFPDRIGSHMSQHELSGWKMSQKFNGFVETFAFAVGFLRKKPVLVYSQGCKGDLLFVQKIL